MAVLGQVRIKINGKELKSKRGATLKLGGVKRTAVVGANRVHGFSKETTACLITAKFTQTPDVGLTFIRNIEDATIAWEGDDQKNYVIAGGACVDEPQLNEVEGEISAQFSGISCDEVTAP
jgi:hypothetical protein